MRDSDRTRTRGDRIVAELNTERAWSYALTLLSRRAYTEAEVRERLGRKRFASDVIDDVVVRLKSYRLIDDEAFAEAFVRSHSPRKGSLALRRDLHRKGVPEAVTEESLETLDDARQAETARKLLERNAWRFRGPDPRRNRTRAFAFLARRGFPAPVSLEAMQRCEGLVSDPDEWPEPG